MRFLVTGGAGFIGSSIARNLLSSGHDVVIVDNLKTGLEKNLPAKAKFLELDIRYYDPLKSAVTDNFDAVFHLAGQSSGEISHDDPQYDLETNALGTLNLLRVAQDLGIKKFLHASTMGVYGDVQEKVCPVKEDMALNPLSFYGVSKLAAEKYLNFFAKSNMSLHAFRMFNVYGPGQNMDNMKQGMVSIYMQYLLMKKEVEVKGALNRFRDFIYIDDVVSAWIAGLNDARPGLHVYNLASGRKVTVKELIDELHYVFGIDSPKVRVLNGTAGDQTGIYASIDKIKSELNWQPKTTLRNGLAEMRKFCETKHDQ